MEKKENSSYIFIPFIFDKPADFRSLVKDLNASSDWSLVEDEILYMLKYVADKINSRDLENCRCFHYMLTEEGAEKNSLFFGEDAIYTTEEHKYCGSPTRFGFRILDVQLFVFSTSVGIVSFHVKYENDEPLWVSSAQYSMKKVSRERICRCGTTDSFTMLGKAWEILYNLNTSYCFNFFYYSNKGTERANVLTLLEVSPQEDYTRELYYLRRCYHDGFVYTEKPELDKKEIHYSAQNILWGISPEAAVCLVCPGEKDKKFFHSTFCTNFSRQYLFMYVLLLHRKYVLYMFLTKLGIGETKRLAELEAYKHQLDEFETDFVFSCITEVPQYQELYEKMADAFSLKAMYKDVHEPLTALAESRRQATEQAQKRAEENTNKAITFLTLLTFASALMDSFQFVSAFFGWFNTPEPWIKGIQGVCIGGIMLIVVWVVKNLITSRRQLHASSKCQIGEKSMPKNYIYIGCFFEPAEIARIAKTFSPDRLARIIPTPHVTFVYKPETVDERLFGETIRVTIDGYGRNETNEGFRVTLSADNPKLQRMIDDIDVVPHITLSVSEDGRSLHTKNLEFRTADPITLCGTFGGYTYSNQVDCRKKN